MDKVSTDNATYLIYTKAPIFDPYRETCDAAYGEAAEVGEKFESLRKIFYQKYYPKNLRRVYVAEKYVLMPNPLLEGGIGTLLVGAGVVFGGLCIRDVVKLWKKRKGLTRRELLGMSAKPLAELAASGTSFGLAFTKIDEITETIEKLQKEKKKPVMPFDDTASAMTAIILEKEVVPRIKKTNPVVCVAVDTDRTGVKEDTLGNYLKDREAARERVEGYRKYLEKTYNTHNIPEAFKQKLYFLDLSTGKQEEFEINVFE